MIKPTALAIGAVVLVVALYFLGDTVPPRPETAPAMLQTDANPSEEDLSGVNPKEQVLASLSEEDRMSLDELQSNATDSSGIFQVYQFWSERNIYLLAGETAYELAQTDAKSESWIMAGDEFMKAIATGEPSWMAASVDKAIDSYTNAKEAGDSSADLLTKLAISYIDGKNEVMTGVQMLLGVVRENPNHGEANFTLGRLAVMSGQFEKALGRFNKLDSLGVQTAEMYLLMSEAYKGLGNTEKSIEALEACKELIEDPELRSEIDKHIQNIRNS